MTDTPTLSRRSALNHIFQDLRGRGLLEETLVLWGGEFGRTPTVQKGSGEFGRDHHPEGFTMWLAGGGVKGGFRYGATDEFFWISNVDGDNSPRLTLGQLGPTDRRNRFNWPAKRDSSTDASANHVFAVLHFFSRPKKHIGRLISCPMAKPRPTATSYEFPTATLSGWRRLAI